VVALEGGSNVSPFPTPLFPSPNPAGGTALRSKRMQIVPGAPAWSAFRLERLLARLRAIDPLISGLAAHFVHFVDCGRSVQANRRGSRRCWPSALRRRRQFRPRTHAWLWSHDQARSRHGPARLPISSTSAAFRPCVASNAASSTICSGGSARCRDACARWRGAPRSHDRGGAC